MTEKKKTITRYSDCCKVKALRMKEKMRIYRFHCRNCGRWCNVLPIPRKK